MPNKAFENRNYIAKREDIPILLDGDAEIIEYNKEKLNLSFKVKGSGDIELPYIYYIGYSAKIDGKDIKVTESENGFCQIHVTSEDFTLVKVSYTGSTCMKISLAVSILSLAFIIILKIRFICSKIHIRGEKSV